MLEYEHPIRVKGGPSGYYTLGLTYDPEQQRISFALQSDKDDFSRECTLSLTAASSKAFMQLIRNYRETGNEEYAITNRYVGNRIRNERREMRDTGQASIKGWLQRQGIEVDNKIADTIFRAISVVHEQTRQEMRAI